MEKLWLDNEIVDRLAMLQQTEADHDGINQIAIEKDWWMTVTLKALFWTACSDALTFKGGTSLSVILLHYPSIIENTVGYIPPRVKIEISCLSMDEPTEVREIRSMIGESFGEEDSVTVFNARTVLPTRTFLEKMFLMSEEFQKERPRSVRMSRHLYDIEKLMGTEYGLRALADHALYDSIVEHRRTYYALKYVDYNLLNPATIDFTLPERVLDAWKEDYANMRRFFIYGQSLEFDALIQRLEDLQKRVRTIAG